MTWVLVDLVEGSVAGWKCEGIYFMWKSVWCFNEVMPEYGHQHEKEHHATRILARVYPWDPSWGKNWISYLFLVVRPGGPSSVLAPSSKARSPVRSFLLLLVRHLLLEAMHLLLVASLLLVVRPGAPFVASCYY